MKDNNLVVLDEGPVSSHTKEDRGTWVGGGHDPAPATPQAVTGGDQPPS